MDEAREQQLVELVGRLRAEADGLRTAMRSRALIEQAKGVLVERTRCSPDGAFERLTAMSQHSGIRLVQVAASLVGSATGDPGGVAAAAARPATAVAGDRLPQPPLFPPAERIPVVSRTRRREALQAQHLLFSTVIRQTDDCEQLASALSEVPGELGLIQRVLIYASQPDGALRVLGGHGYDEQTRSDWARIPSGVDTPPTVTVRTRRPVWVPDRQRLTSRFPALSVPDEFTSGALACLPLVLDDCLVGVLVLSWSDSQSFDTDGRDYLTALADLVCSQLDALDLDDLCPTAALDESGGSHALLVLVLEGLLSGAAMLTPLYDVHGEAVDFRIDHCNALAGEVTGRPAAELIGRTVLEFYPGLLHGELLSAARSVLEDGGGRTVPNIELPVDGPSTTWGWSVRLSRLWNGLLVVAAPAAVAADQAVPKLVSPRTPTPGAAALASG